MKLSDLLPAEGLPRAENYVTPDLRWTLGDTEQGYRASGGHPIYDETSVEYKLNSLGYRCPEFIDRGQIRMISIGCSYTYGVGLPQTALFHERFAERLGSEIGTSVVNWNLGSGAVSNNYIARLMHIAVPILKPDIVLILFTHLSRREYITAANEALKYRPTAMNTDPVHGEIFDHLSALTSKYDDQLNFFRDFKSIKALLTGTLWAYSFCNASEVSNIGIHLEANHRVRDHLIEGSRSRRAGPRDTARDHRHPGPLTHQTIYECFWEWFVQANGVERMKYLMSIRPQV
jgi:hypothetical protein